MMKAQTTSKSRQFIRNAFASGNLDEAEMAIDKLVSRGEGWVANEEIATLIAAKNRLRLYAVNGCYMQIFAAADAVSVCDSVNNRIRDAYTTLFSNAAFPYEVQRGLRDSFKQKDWNKMEAAIEVMALHGDYNLITDEIAEATATGLLYEYDEAGNIVEDIASEGNIRLMDVLIKYKNDAAHLAMYAKSMIIRRKKQGNFDGKIQEWISSHPDKTCEQAVEALFVEISSKRGVPAEVAKHEYRNSTRPLSLVEWAKDDSSLGMVKMLGDIIQPSIVKSQDRTTFAAIGDLMSKAGVKPGAGQAGFLIKQLRSASTSDEIDGEELRTLTDLLLWHREERSDGTIEKVLNSDTIAAYLKGMSGKQLAGMKALQFAAINDALMQEDGAFNNGKTSPLMLSLLQNAIQDIASGDHKLISETDADILSKISSER